MPTKPTLVAKKILTWIVKLVIFVIAWAYVVYKFKTTDGDIFLIFNNENFRIVPFCFVFLLMFVNWGLESFKWQKLINCSQPISYSKAVSGVLVGLPLALVTPNRIGELGGRAIVLKQNRKDAVFATVLGSLTQLTTTLLMGVLGIVCFILFCNDNEMIQKASYISLCLIAFLLIFVCVCHNKRWFKKLLLRVLGKKYFRQLTTLQEKYSRQDLLRTLLLSICRYIVFGSQFGILIAMLIPELSFVEIFIGISLMYLFTTICPTAILGEIGIRGSVAIFVFQLFTNNASVLFQISLLIWLINIAIPTLVGSILLIGTKNKN